MPSIVARRSALTPCGIEPVARLTFGSKKPAPWFDEGMAMMVESAVIDGKKLTFRADRRLNWVHRLIKAQKLPDWHEK